MARKDIHIMHRVLPYGMQNYEMLMRSAAVELKQNPDQGMKIALVADRMLRTEPEPRALNIMSKLAANTTTSRRTLKALGDMFMDKMAKLSSEIPTSLVEQSMLRDIHCASDLPRLMVGTLSAASKAGPLLRNPNTDTNTKKTLIVVKGEVVERVRMAKPLAQLAGYGRG